MTNLILPTAVFGAGTVAIPAGSLEAGYITATDPDLFDEGTAAAATEVEEVRFHSGIVPLFAPKEDLMELAWATLILSAGRQNFSPRFAEAGGDTVAPRPPKRGPVYEAVNWKGKGSFARVPDMRGERDPLGPIFALKKAGRWAELCREAERLLQGPAGLKPKWRYRLWFELGKGYSHLGDSAKALLAFETAAAIQRTADVLIQMSTVWRMRGDSRKAQEVLEEAQAANGGSNVTLLIERTLALRKRGLYKDALGVLDQAQEAAQGEAIFFAKVFRFRAILLMDLKLFDQAHQAVELSIINADDATEKAKALQVKGDILLAEGKRDEALQAVLEAIALDPNRGRFYLLAADIYRRGGRFDQARNILEEGLEKLLTLGQRFDTGLLYEALLSLLVRMGERELASSLAEDAVAAGVSPWKLRQWGLHPH